MGQPRDAHLPRRIAQASHAHGPFSFLNPTTRYVPVPAKRSRVGVTASGTQPSTTDSEKAVGGPNGSANGPASSGSEAAVSNTDDRESSRPEVQKQEKQPSSSVHGAYQIWRSRDNRKGRHAIVLTKDFSGKQDDSGQALGLPRISNSVAGVLHNICKMFVRYPVWDVSYDVAMLFTIGSVVWVINSFFVWLPLAAPSTEFANEETTAGGVSALVGATIFEVGAILGLLEAVNENRSDCFGYALEEALESGMLHLRPSPSHCQHSHVERSNLFKKRMYGSGSDNSGKSSSGDMLDQGDGATTTADGDESNRPSPHSHSSSGKYMARQWSWCPSWNELRTVYVYEMGFWACAIQLAGATIFWISGFVGLPSITGSLSQAANDGIYWLPQVVGGMGFVISSIMFMLETQKKWYIPALEMLGWHIGAWNLVGAIGFTLCGAFGFASNSSYGMEYASTMSTFVGSWAFLIGSIIQWYESLDKYPIQITDSPPGQLDA